MGASCVKSVAAGSMIRFLLLTTPLVIRGAATDYRMTNSVESCWTAAVYSNFIELVDAKKRQEPAKSVEWRKPLPRIVADDGLTGLSVLMFPKSHHQEHQAAMARPAGNSLD